MTTQTSSATLLNKHAALHAAGVLCAFSNTSRVRTVSALLVGEMKIRGMARNSTTRLATRISGWFSRRGLRLSKMVNPALEHRSLPLRLMLCLLIGCLLTHFLVENICLLPGLPAAQLTAAEAHPGSPDELEEQDDLVVLPMLPPQNADTASRAILAWIPPLFKQAISPLLKPPQI